MSNMTQRLSSYQKLAIEISVGIPLKTQWRGKKLFEMSRLENGVRPAYRVQYIWDGKNDRNLGERDQFHIMDCASTVEIKD